jgi:hypothetical protein
MDFLRKTIVMAALAALVTGGGAAAAQAGAVVADMGDDMGQISHALATEMTALSGVDWRSGGPEPLTGYAFGVTWLVPMRERFGWQFEVVAARRGVAFDMISDAVTVESSFKLSYLEVPVLARFAVGPTDGVHGVLLAGPVVGFKADAEFTASVPGNEESVDVGDQFKTTVFSGLVGAGVAVPLGESRRLLLQARFQKGISNALDDTAYESNGKDFAILAGIEFLGSR